MKAQEDCEWLLEAKIPGGWSPVRRFETAEAAQQTAIDLGMPLDNWGVLLRCRYVGPEAKS